MHMTTRYPRSLRLTPGTRIVAYGAAPLPRSSLARICELLAPEWDRASPADYAPAQGWQANTRKVED